MHVRDIGLDGDRADRRRDYLREAFGDRCEHVIQDMHPDRRHPAPSSTAEPAYLRPVHRHDREPEFTSTGVTTASAPSTPPHAALDGYWPGPPLAVHASTVGAPSSRQSRAVRFRTTSTANTIEPR